jgi:hypothetical protein
MANISQDEITGVDTIFVKDGTGLIIRLEGSGDAIRVVNPKGTIWSVGPQGNSGGINARAEMLGLAAVTVDPVYAITNHQATSGVVHGVAVYLPAGKVLTKISCFIQTAGVGLTNGQLGIYDSNFSLVAVTPDTPAAFQATGWIELSFTQTFVVPSSGAYHLADTYAGTTMPFYKAAGQTIGPNHALLPSGVLSYWQQAGQNTLPSTATPTASGVAHMMAVR